IVASVHLGKTTPGRRCRRSPSAALVSIPSSRFSLLCCKGNLCHFTACRVYNSWNINSSILETTDIRRITMAKILSQHWLLSRRHALRGLGVSLALPLLDCMRPLLAGDAATRAKRSVFIYLPNGVNTIDYQITQAGADYRFS